MTLFEPITANITIAIEALESLHIDWHEMTQTETEFVTLKANSVFEISTHEPWIIRRKEDGFIPKFSKNNSGYFVQKKTGVQIVYLSDSNDRRVAINVNKFKRQHNIIN
ncbi:MAG: hypothetical protein EZS28_040140 [Streblomastix strix]|uniref:Uncharacterized protein n=1 Tax=Streblomastix strix TaxID=222440 RepID=A0A5J4U243_9EUKA|nr:MAG: hypothetical protein EZS28_040140 [Streblomastix strix]